MAEKLYTQADLEGLLREARLDEAKWWEHLSQASHEQHPSYEDCMYCVRIAKLEKARANEGKGMSERLSAEDRATRAINKAASAWKTDLKASPPFWGITQQEVAKEIEFAEEAAAEAERERQQEECSCNCHDEETRDALSMKEHVSCALCAEELVKEADQLARSELLQPITDKSICKRGHARACLVEREITNIEKNEGPLNDTEYCSACAQMDAEFGWSRGDSK